MIDNWAEHARDFADEAHEAVRKVAERHGVFVTMKPITPASTTLNLLMKAHLVEPKISGPEAIFLGTYEKLGVARDDLGRRFMWKGRVAKLIGAQIDEAQPLMAQLPNGAIETMTVNEFRDGCSSATPEQAVDELSGEW